jgi:hypothetical protein
MVGEVLLHLVAASALALEAVAQVAEADLHLVKVNSQGLYTHLLIIQKPLFKWVDTMVAGARALAGHTLMQGAVAQAQ